MDKKPYTRLRMALTVTFALTLAVVFAGATVRATGAGMGCPDWPLCFGCLIPPVSVQQLPPDFAQKYAVAGHPAEFDAVKTWTEYLNRMAGVAAGVALVVSAVMTAFVVRRRPSLGGLVVVTLVVLGGVSWLGARVVGTFLEPYSVTIHLLSAYLLLLLLLAQREIAGRAADGPRPRANRSQAVVLAVVGLAFAAQWTLGIRTREEVEAFIWNQDLAQTLWGSLASSYDLHKVTASLVAAGAAVFAFVGWKAQGRDRRFFFLSMVCAGLVVAQAFEGLVLWFGGLPAWAKPFHLLTATGAWCAWAAAVLHILPSGETHDV